MKHLLIFTLFALITFMSSAEESGKVRLTTLGCGLSAEFLFEIPKSKADALPKWHPDRDDPAPVTLKQACELAKSSLKKRYPSADEFQLGQVRLTEIVSKEKVLSEPLGTWFYEFTFLAKRNGVATDSCAFAVILADGTSVEPVITRRAKP